MQSNEERKHVLMRRQWVHGAIQVQNILGTVIGGFGSNCESVRPALHLNLKSSVWSYAGTVSSAKNHT